MLAPPSHHILHIYLYIYIRILCSTTILSTTLTMSTNTNTSDAPLPYGWVQQHDTSGNIFFVSPSSLYSNNLI